MRLVDANLLLYAVDTRSPRHRAARSWLEEQLSSEDAIAFAWAPLLAFLRLSTSPRVFERPLPPERAFDVVDRWLAQPCAVIVHPGDRHAALMRQLLRPLGTAANLVSDAHLAAQSWAASFVICLWNLGAHRHIFPRYRPGDSRTYLVKTLDRCGPSQSSRS